jgi:phosphate transport system substrate-binding protein
VYSKWFDAYNKKTGVAINYQSIGSGGGIRQFTQGHRRLRRDRQSDVR